MLKQGQRPQAWLLSDGSSRALSLKARAALPAVGHLCFYTPFFALSDPEPWFIGDEIEFNSEAPIPLPSLVHKVEPSSADFARTFEEILIEIQAGRFEKVVPMVCEELEFSEPLQRNMFRIEQVPQQFTYGFEFENEGMAGVTPELLFSVEDGVLRTMALAGTGKSDGPSLLADRKEMHEHGLVIEHIANELKHFGVPVVGETVEKVYGALKHLYTPITLRLERKPEFMELIASLHPTAALGGWPRKPAVEWLEKQPFHVARKRFGAPFGFSDGQIMKCVVAIRGVQWSGNCLQVASGCGVVKESQVLREWQELELKRRSIYRWLGVEL